MVTLIRSLPHLSPSETACRFTPTGRCAFRDPRHIATAAAPLNAVAPARMIPLVKSGETAMTDAINATEVLDSHELDAVSGGFIHLPLVAVKVASAIKGGGGGEPGPTGGQNDPAQMFQQIMQQLTQQG